jgi:hypothetical protein
MLSKGEILSGSSASIGFDRRFLLPSLVLVAILAVAFAGVDHEDAFSGVGFFLVDDDDAGGDAGAVEEVGGQAYDAFDVASADQIAADFAFGVGSE